MTEEIKEISEVGIEITEITEEPREEQFYTVLGVMFDITKKRYYFEVVDKDEVYKKGDKVIVDTIRGQEIGIVYNLPITLSEKKFNVKIDRKKIDCSIKALGEHKAVLKLHPEVKAEMTVVTKG